MHGAGPESTAAPLRLKRRADFLHVGKGLRLHGRLFTVQCAARTSDVPPRIGLTVTKKVGNAVRRNRVRRRLKEALRLAGHLPVVSAHDYVLVARDTVLTAPFEGLKTDLVRSLHAVHTPTAGRSRGKPKASRPAEQSY